MAMKPLHPGQMSERITFQVRGEGVDALGQASGPWANVATDPTVWASSAFVTGRDVAVAGQYQATLDAKFVVRYRSDIRPTWRVLWNGQPFEILGDPAPVGGRREYMELRCTRGVRDGR
jgi:SPP1 family predicted phage head-tail adaptor